MEAAMLARVMARRGWGRGAAAAVRCTAVAQRNVLRTGVRGAGGCWRGLATGSGDEGAVVKTGYKARKQGFVKKYGVPGICIYAAISIGDLSLLYLAARAGLDIGGILDAVGLSWLTQDSDTSAQAAEQLGPFVVAYAAHKLLMPARFALSLAVTPPMVRFMQEKGWVKSRTEGDGGSGRSQDQEQEAAGGGGQNLQQQEAAGGGGQNLQQEAAGGGDQDLDQEAGGRRFATAAAAEAAKKRAALRDVSH